ncbi:unnamed protein product [Urochloa humidicola]
MAESCSSVPSKRDCTWMYEDRESNPLSYISGVSSFMKQAKKHQLDSGSRYLPCPCRDCRNETEFDDPEKIREHLLLRGFHEKYHNWSNHGETDDDDDGGSTTIAGDESVEGNHMSSREEYGCGDADECLSDDDECTGEAFGGPEALARLLHDAMAEDDTDEQ